MGIDPDVANWVLEFLLRQPLDDGTLDSLLRILPLSDDKRSLKKLLLLKKLESDVSRRCLSEKTLELLEQLEEIEFRQGQGKEASDAMKRAYCAVAVECTVRVLERGGEGKEDDDCRRFRFFEGVVRVWRGRIGAMEKEGLSSEDLWIWKDDIEAAVWDDGACERLMKKREGINVVDAVKDYLKGEMENLGPSFLEVVADRVKNDVVTQRMLGMGSVDPVAPRNEAPDSEDACNVNNESQKGQVHLRNKLVRLRRSRGSRNSKRAKIVDSDEAEAGPSYKDYNLQSSEAIPGVASDRKCGDPMEKKHGEAASGILGESEHSKPLGANCAEAISGAASKRECFAAAEENRPEANLNAVDDTGVVQATDYKARDVPGPSLIEQNSSSRAHEDESVGGHQDGPEDSRARPLLRRRSTINISPLKKHEIQNYKRRKARKWSPLEEDTLRTGVEKFGQGNWKFILMAYRDIFVGRTDVDLKDKWRNLTRR
ncbi:uncharacterized protein LOC127259334 isoform X2 [Andrographis paniculata]|uniref:uncharacterized protein LOC127259334 isoform X2 n=1 Tax=Andrographis paniculata TaxID=175694 RepID=UPI0021E809A5|nr:uncharacterized protein LOC127259334 isoform X2 [Andrographis paniculata]